MKQVDKNTVTGIDENTTHIKDNKGNVYELNKSGIDDSGKEVTIAQDISKSLRWISPTKFILPNGKIGSSDQFEHCFEAYNPNSKTIYFKNDHYEIHSKMNTPDIIKIEPDCFAFIPHSYYIPYIGYIGNNSGETFNIIKNMGKMMFTGNKLPSKQN